MTSLHAYTNPGAIYAPNPKPVFRIVEGTILDVLQKTPKVNRFLSLIYSVPSIVDTFNTHSISITLFVPICVSNCCSYSQSMDTIHRHTLERIIAPTFIDHNSLTSLITRKQGFTILMEKTPNGIILNKRSLILGVKKAGRSLLYFIDHAL